MVRSVSQGPNWVESVLSPTVTASDDCAKEIVPASKSVIILKYLSSKGYFTPATSVVVSPFTIEKIAIGVP